MSILYPIDFLFFPLYTLLLLAFFYRKKKSYAGSPIESYFLKAWLLRASGAVLTAMMYQYYYGYGDTFFYYTGVNDIFRTFLRSPFMGLEMVFSDYQDWPPEARHGLTLHGFFLKPSEAIVIHVASLFGIFGLGTYSGTSILMTAFAFAGTWRLYRVFTDMYPHLHRPLAWAILYLPSLWFWGTGVMKDSLTLGGLGFFVWGFYQFFIKRRKLVQALFWMLVGAWLMARIKAYILIAILPAAIAWLFLMYRAKIANKTVRWLATPVFLVFALIGGALALQLMSKQFEKFASLEKILEEANKTQWWLEVSTQRDGGTGYTLGEFDASPLGLLKVAPKAINVALFRPYPWEARKPIVMPSAAEALLSLLFTLWVLLRLGPLRLIRELFADPVILFCLIFALIFAFAVGFTSFNFGALARYRIPCLPFYFTALVLLNDKVGGKSS